MSGGNEGGIDRIDYAGSRRRPLPVTKNEEEPVQQLRFKEIPIEKIVAGAKDCVVI